MADVSFERVSKRYGARAIVEDFDLRIEDGAFVVLVGGSGCGKSTTLRMLAGLESVSAGTIRIGGREVTHLPPGERDVAMVFQDYALYPHLTVRENIDLGLRLRKVAKHEIERRVRWAAETLELSQLLDRKPAQLSGGQRQRVAMGRAMVREPQVFLFDEPLSNLDAKLRGQMRTEISRLQRRLGITTIYVTHDQTEAMTLGDRVCVLRKGIVQQIASPRELYEQPVNLFVAGFIGSPPMNFLPATVSGNCLEMPFGRIDLDDRQAKVVAGHDVVLVGIRPEYFEDASLVDEAKRSAGTTFRAMVDVTEWLGDSQYAYIPFDAPEDVTTQLRDLSRELDSDQLRTQAVVSIDAASRMREGHEAEFWLDTSKMHIFDPKSGDNLTRDPEAGAELTRMATEERTDQLEQARTERGTTPEARGSSTA